jgi:hypothetical protein
MRKSSLLRWAVGFVLLVLAGLYVSYRREPSSRNCHRASLPRLGHEPGLRREDAGLRSLSLDAGGTDAGPDDVEDITYMD